MYAWVLLTKEQILVLLYHHAALPDFLVTLNSALNLSMGEISLLTTLK